MLSFVFYIKLFCVVVWSGSVYRFFCLQISIVCVTNVLKCCFVSGFKKKKKHVYCYIFRYAIYQRSVWLWEHGSCHIQIVKNSFIAKYFVLCRLIREENYFGSSKETSDVTQFLNDQTGQTIVRMMTVFTEELSSKWNLHWPVNLPSLYVQIRKLHM